MDSEGREMLPELKYNDSSSQCLVRKDPGSDFMDFRAEVILFTSEKPSFAGHWGF